MLAVEKNTRAEVVIFVQGFDVSSEFGRHMLVVCDMT
jgi:hypothetical protein